MAVSARSSFTPPLALCCLLAILFLIASTIVLALIPVYLSARNINVGFNSPTETLSAGYASDQVGARSDSIADTNSLSTQLASQSGQSTNTLALNQGNFVSATAASKKRQIGFGGTVTCERATGLFGDIFVAQYQITYPRFCLGFCRRRFKNKLINSLRKNYAKFTVTINFAIVGIRQVTLQFCGLFGSGAVGCTTETRNYAYLMDTNNTLYQFNPTNYNVATIGPINCPTSSNLYSIALQRNGILWAGFEDGTLFRYNVKSKVCTSTTFAANQSNFEQFTMTFLKSTTDNSESLYLSQQNSIGNTLGKIDINTFILSVVGNYSDLNTFADISETNNGVLYGLFETDNYTVAQINPNNAQILAEYPLNISSTIVSDPNYGFTIANGVFFFFEGINNGTNIHIFSLSTNSTTLVSTIAPNIYGAASSSCLSTL